MSDEAEQLHEVYLGLGSNLGDREANIRKAISLIGGRLGTVLRCSTLIETEPWGFKSGHQFLNGAVACQTKLTPREVLKEIQAIERELGKQMAHATKRSRTTSNNAVSIVYKDRPIDIDILLYDDLKVDEPDLKIPHPLMQARDFVMIPLKEILD